MPLHALFEALGYALGFQLYRRLKKQHGDFLPNHLRFQLVIAAIMGALLGSKIPGLMDHFFATAHTGAWFSSKTVVGGLLGGLVAVEGLKKWHGIRRATGDIWTQPVLLGMILGRIGCFLAGPEDGTWGQATSSHFGIDVGSGVALHPAPLYEILFLFMCMLMVYRISLWKPHWNRYRLFLIAYLIFRFGIDTIKLDPVIAWQLTSIQWVCMLGILGLGLTYKKLSDPILDKVGDIV